MRAYLFLLLGLIPLALSGQSRAGIVHSLEGGWQHAIFDPAQGGMFKVNHHWRESEKARFQSGIMLSGLLRPGVSPATTGTLNELNTAYRLSLHTGWVRHLGQKQKLYGLLEGYLGLRAYYTRGTLDQPSQGFSRSYSDFTTRGDWGLRFGLGYQLTERLGLQSALTASFIDANHPLGFYTGILFWSPDVLSVAEISLNWRLGA